MDKESRRILMQKVSSRIDFAALSATFVDGFWLWQVSIQVAAADGDVVDGG